MRTFHEFLEDRGFQADACESLEDPDFYRLAKSMHEALERISEDRSLSRAQCRWLASETLANG